MAFQLIEEDHIYPIFEFSKLSKSALHDLVILLENSNFFHLHSPQNEHDKNQKITLVVKLDDLRSTRHSLEVDRHNIPQQVQELFSFVKGIYAQSSTPKKNQIGFKQKKHVHFKEPEKEPEKEESKFCCIL